MRLYKHKVTGELVTVGDKSFMARHPLVDRWFEVDSLLIKRHIDNGKLLLIGNNFRLK